MFCIYFHLASKASVFLGERGRMMLVFIVLSQIKESNYKGHDAVKREKFVNKGTLTLSCHFYS